MKKLNKVAVLFASAALASPVVFAQATAVDNWRAADGTTVWKNGSNELCWRDANWTPATAAADCDGALKPPPPPPRRPRRRPRRPRLRPRPRRRLLRRDPPRLPRRRPR